MPKMIQILDSVGNFSILGRHILRSLADLRDFGCDELCDCGVCAVVAQKGTKLVHALAPSSSQRWRAFLSARRFGKRNG